MITSLLLWISFLFTPPATTVGGAADFSDPDDTDGVTLAAARTCDHKVKLLQEFAPKAADERQTLRFTAEEINSYLALVLAKKYHPSLKRLVVELGDSALRGIASIDFDRLSLTGKQGFSRFLPRLFAGIHQLRIDGILHADEGTGRFEVRLAQFDRLKLPVFLVEEIVSAVGKKQTPPFDPIRPSSLPYGIKRVDVLPGEIIIRQ